MKILILNQAFHPDVVATAQYASDLAIQLVERGHDVTAVASQRGYADPNKSFAWSETWRGIRILRCYNSGLGKKAPWKRAVNFATFFLSCAVRVSVLPKFDAIITLTSPPLISTLAAALATANGARLIYWVMDLNPDEAIAAGWLRSDSRATRILTALSGFSFQKSDRVVVLDRFMASRLARKGVPSSKLAVVPLWPLDEGVSYNEEGANAFRRQFGLQDKFVVMYSGNHSPCHPLTTLMEAMNTLRDEQHIIFCFVGGGSEFNAVKNFAETHKLASLRCLPYQSFANLSSSLSAANLHVVVMGDPFVGIVHPSKVYNIQRLGIPFLYIGPSSSPIAELAPATSLRHGDVSGVSEFIRTAATLRISRSAQRSVQSPRIEVIKRLMCVIEAQPTSI